MSAQRGGWSDFYDAVAKRPPRDTLLKALAKFDMGAPTEQFAIDLGCGSGADTREMLRRGWTVLAIDREAEGIQRLCMSITDEQMLLRLITRVVGFEKISDLPACDLVNASFSLPFCQPAHFDNLWQCVVCALRPRGRFAGTLFGVRDSWAATERMMTFHTRKQVDALLNPFVVEDFIEAERDGNTAVGESKHWHVYHIVARKR
jgi:SAM-dependent methyltransferase